jgi:hypothetical protein
MTKSILLSAFILFSSLFSSNLMAQLGSTSVSISGGQFFKNPISFDNTSSVSSFGGFSSGGTKQTSKFTPHIALKVERRFGKHFSLGVDFHSTTMQSERTIDNSFPNFNGTTTTTVVNIVKQKISSKLGGMALNIKGFLFTNEEADLYVGATAGFFNNNEDIETVSGNTTNSFVTDSNGSGGLLELNLGFRYFLPNNLGFYGEVGNVKIQSLNGLFGQVGVIYRF